MAKCVVGQFLLAFFNAASKDLPNPVLYTLSY